MAVLWQAVHLILCNCLCLSEFVIRVLKCSFVLCNATKYRLYIKSMEKVSAEKHPGAYVRETILKNKKMTVTEVAKILGIGRPAFSNFLNGNASLSVEMAARIERAFGVPAQKLHDLQSAHDMNKAKGAPANTSYYVPPFLGILANEIETWASSITARTRLSVFLRTLVNSTGISLTKIDFPGNDDAERPGWDGFVTATEGTPWIPEGQSGWEFGCNNEPKAKADKDYLKSVKAIDKSDRSEIIFVFVTPQRWPGKSKWISDRKTEDQWKDVRAYDSSDLEQWMEQSVAGQTWFANETQRPSNGTRSLDKCWADWSQVAYPPLPRMLFKTAVEAAKAKVESTFAKPAEKPIIITADSIEEAVGFLSELFSKTGENLLHLRDQVVVFDEPGVLPKLADGSSTFIAVATTREVEREFGPFCRTIHTIAVYPRNAVNAEPDISLEPLNYEGFHSALEGAGYERDDINRLDNESGRSLTVLRRRLAKVPAIRTPAWAIDQEVATGLVPFMFAGAWHSSNLCDQAILSFLAKNTLNEDLERNVQKFAGLNDAPVWSVGSYRGVISKIDSLFAISGTITRVELVNYFEVAEFVLSEDDPGLNLPESDRLFASLLGKTREISGTLRKGISESLVLLAVHGNTLFQKRLGVDVESMAVLLIRKLLGDPLTTRKLELHDRDLPIYAETAPDEFLKIIEKDLKSPESACLGLMRPANSGIFSGCPRTGLLWALENLAWSSTTFSRAVLALAKLAEIRIEDNWANKPISSLKAVFRSWMPQTAASVDKRVKTMELLANHFPKIAWEICVDQFSQYNETGWYNHKPRWRGDAQGYGNPEMNNERRTFIIEMVNMALSWQEYDRTMLGDLIERLQSLDDSWQETIWIIIKNWAAKATDSDKAWMREKIRVAILSRRATARNKETKSDKSTITAKETYTALEPTDILSKYEWLFRETWVQESYDELHDEELDYELRVERITKMRAHALQTIMAERGVEGVLKLAEMGKTPAEIGAIMAASVLSVSEVISFIITVIQPSDKADSWAYINLARGAIRSMHDDSYRTDLLKKVRDFLPPESFVKLLEQAPFRKATWSLVEDLNEPYQQTYWREVMPSWERQDDNELNTSVDQLLAAKRPRAAFHSVHLKLENLRPSALFRLLESLATDGAETEGHYQLDSYYINKAFETLQTSSTFSVEQMAGLEFIYLDVLVQSRGINEHGGIPNLERYIDTHPEFFAQIVAWIYKRQDSAEDPEGLKITNFDLVQNRALKGYKLLEGLRRVPGRDKQGAINEGLLLDWVNIVRIACTKLGREEGGDSSLGKWLSNAPKGTDGIWPCEPVRWVLEQIQSEKISDGITLGLFNARGVHFRGESGDQERELAAMYREWSSALEFSFPFVASSILKRMANTYYRDAQHEDTEAVVRRRLR